MIVISLFYDLILVKEQKKIILLKHPLAVVTVFKTQILFMPPQFLKT